ncbi:MAG: biotin--[acetyl-CoA-carboxylase] ligase [Rhodothalassiaceae bacterium]
MVRLIQFELLDSTQAEAGRRVVTGQLRQATILLADRQSDGRGSRGRQWHSPAGNLHATLCLPMDARWLQPYLAVYPVALALGQVIARLAGQPAQLKWPNDVLINGAKVSGALHEVAEGPTGRWFLAGLGINLAHRPDRTPYPAGDLAATGPHDPAVVAATLAEAVMQHIAMWLDTGFAPVRDRYLRQMAFLSQPITVRTRHGEALEGINQGIEADGALRLETATGPVRVLAGDIFPSLAD